MHIRYGYRLEITCERPMPVITMLDVHPDRRHDLTEADDMVVTALDASIPPLAPISYFDQFGNICRRVTAPVGGIRLEAQGTIFDSGFNDPVVPDAVELTPDNLPDEVLVYLLGSRYCETDSLAQQAWNLFGTTERGWTRVQAICDFVHGHIVFGYHFASNTRSAAQVISERVGVCRDFAHLAITLCRCMNIPARYCTGYLGDIGVPADPNPMDFSAWFEAFLDGQWYAFDARHNKPRIGRIVVARGRDATDVPIINSFGGHSLTHFEIVTEEVTDSRFPATSGERRDYWARRGPPGSGVVV